MADGIGRRLRARNRAGRRLVACGGALGLMAAALPAMGAPAASSSIVVNYTTPTSIQVTLGDGTAVGPGSTIPAGSYTITVKDDPNTGDLSPLFTLSGPGVSLSNNLNSTGMGIDATSTFGPYTLQPSSSYSIEDATLGSSTLVTFMTSAGSGATSTPPAAPAGTSSPVPATTSSSAGATSSSGKSTGQSGKGSSAAAGSAARAILEATVSAGAKATLTMDGRAVKTLERGTYTIKLVDRSKTVDFVIGKTPQTAVKLAGTGAAGASSRTLTLGPGRWFFEAGSAGAKTYFTVSA